MCSSIIRMEVKFVKTKMHKIRNKCLALFLATVMFISVCSGALTRYDPETHRKTSLFLCSLIICLQYEDILKPFVVFISLEERNWLSKEIYAKFLSYLERLLTIRFLKFLKKPASLLHTFMK